MVQFTDSYCGQVRFVVTSVSEENTASVFRRGMNRIGNVPDCIEVGKWGYYNLKFDVPCPSETYQTTRCHGVFNSVCNVTF
jgi:hypothetical protein